MRLFSYSELPWSCAAQNKYSWKLQQVARKFEFFLCALVLECTHSLLMGDAFSCFFTIARLDLALVYGFESWPPSEAPTKSTVWPRCHFLPSAEVIERVLPHAFSPCCRFWQERGRPVRTFYKKSCAWKGKGKDIQVFHVDASLLLIMVRLRH